jgi:secreted trypsin-like serine protease
LRNANVAKQLCSSVGRSKGTFDNSVEGNGVLFTASVSDTDNQLIPGFEASSYGKCNVSMLKCSEQQCGIRKANLVEPNIQFGHDAVDDEWPWAVQVFRGNRFTCTGMLIDSHTIITAAHCLSDSTYVTYYIRVGTTKKNEGTRYLVSKAQKHDEYRSYLYGNDIGLLTVKSEIIMSSHVQPVCLPEHPASTDKECFVTGWGRDEKGGYPTKLQEAKVYLLEKSDCMKYYSYQSNSTLCANNKEDNQPTCFGDSGGPLVCRNTHGNWVAYGVTSYGRSGCARTDSSPAAFADIYNLMTWVEENR